MARKPPQPNAENCSLAELEVAARAAPHHAGYNRLTAIRALLRGVPHEIAAQLAGVSARTLAAWTGAFYALEFTHTDTEVFRCLLEHANQDVPRPRKRNLLIMDNAGWHKTRSLPWGAFEPVHLTTALAHSVLSFGVAPNGTIVHTNGSEVLCRNADGTSTRLCTQRLIEQVVAV